MLEKLLRNVLGIDFRTPQEQKIANEKYQRLLRIREYNYKVWLREEFELRLKKRLKEETVRRSREEQKTKSMAMMWLASLMLWQQFFAAFAILAMEIAIAGISLFWNPKSNSLKESPVQANKSDVSENHYFNQHNRSTKHQELKT